MVENLGMLLCPLRLINGPDVVERGKLVSIRYVQFPVSSAKVPTFLNPLLRATFCLVFALISRT